MLVLFRDLEEATANSVEIARRCAYRPRTRQPIMPRFIREAPAGAVLTLDEIEARELREQALAGLEQRGSKPPARRRAWSAPPISRGSSSNSTSSRK